MEVIKEYQAQGKIKHVGFSSHGTVDVIVSAIETGLFDYVNLHYHFIGSYVSTGTGPCGGNLAALKAAQKQDMGVFIISPSDKGGALYEPPKTLYKACLPLTPIAFNNLYLWSSEIPIHTLGQWSACHFNSLLNLPPSPSTYHKQPNPNTCRYHNRNLPLTVNFLYPIRNLNLTVTYST